MRVLDDKNQTILAELKHLLINFLPALKDQQAEEKDLDLIKDLILQIDDLFVIVVAGEYNSGKSAFINALLGGDYLETGITPTTSKITIIRHGNQDLTQHNNHNQVIRYLPINILEDISIVDTPGTNAVLRDHEEITTDFIPRSDLVLFVTSVDRPFTESEKQFLERIRAWGKKIIFIINKIDIIEMDNTLNEVINYIFENSRKVLATDPVIFSVSSKKALETKKTQVGNEKGLQEIEDFLKSTLGSNEYLSLKFSNPIGVIENLIQKYTSQIINRKDVLSADFQLIEDISNDLKLFKDEMIKNFQYRYAHIDNALLEFEKRGMEFFENTFRLGRIFDLINKERIQSEYQDVVVRGLSAEIDNQVNKLIDWLVEEDLKRWQAVTLRIDQRSQQYRNRILDDQNSRQIRFERQKIIEKVNSESEKIMLQFNQKEEAKRIAEEAQMAVAASAAIEAGALGLGAIVTMLATTASADLTGVFLAGLTAVVGLFIIPAKKRNIKTIFNRNINKIRKDLSDILLNEFEKQINNIVNHIENTISPYTRFIKSEHEKLQNFHDKFSQFLVETKNIKNQLNS